MNRKPYFPFCILLLCFLLQGGILGIISNCRGLFYDPVCQELGIPLGEFTTYATFYGLAVCISIPLATKLIPRCDLRLTLGLSAVVVSAAQYAMGWFTAPWQWYIAASIQGVGHALLFVQTVPMLISNWFSVKQGFFLGLACSSSGIVGAIMNTVTAKYMAVHGWRASYRFLGIILFLLMVPASLLFAVRSPEAIGADPYGKGREESPNLKRAVVQNSQPKALAYPLLAVYACLICLTVGYNQILVSLGQFLGHSRELVSTFTSAAMIATVLWKLIVGWCNDRFGPAATCYFSGGVIILGLAAALLGRSLPLMYLGSFCLGMPMALSIVVLPNLVRSLYGNTQFNQRYKLVSMLANLSSNFSFTLIGWLISLAGYPAALLAGLGVTGGALILATLFLSLRERKETP